MRRTISTIQLLSFVAFAFLCCCFIVVHAGVDVQFATRVGGPNRDKINSVAVDKSNNAFAVGVFCGPEISIFGSFVYNETAKKCDGFVTKFSPNGNVLWNIVVTGDNDESITSVVVDPFNYVYVAGYFRSNVSMIPKSPSKSNQTFYYIQNNGTTASSDIFLAKIDQDGNVLWVSSGGGSDEELSSGLAVDYLGNVFISGSFNSPKIQFGAIISNVNVRFSGFVIKINRTGIPQWIEQIGGNSLDDYAHGIATDVSGNVAVIGTFSSYVSQFGSITLKNLGGVSSYVMKEYSRGGGKERYVLWAVSLGGMDVDIATGVACDLQGNVWVTGYFRSTIALFGTVYLLNLSPEGNANIFLVKLDTYGKVLLGKSLGGLYSDIPNGLAIDTGGSVYLVGTFTSSIAYFGEAKPVNTIGKGNVFVTKCDPNGVFQWTTRVGGKNNENATSIAVGANRTIVVTGFSNSPFVSFQSKNVSIDLSLNETDGFIAFFQETSACMSNPCLNNGSCFLRPSGYGCFCTNGYSGSNCGIQIVRACSSNPCMNNGLCLEASGSFICKCTAPFTDAFCETDSSVPVKQSSGMVAGVGVAAGVILFIFFCAYFITRSAEGEKKYDFSE